MTSASVCFGFVLYLLILINCTVCVDITSSHHTTAVCWWGCIPDGGGQLFPVNRKSSSVAIGTVEPALTDTSPKRTLFLVPRVATFERFHCNNILLLNTLRTYSGPLVNLKVIKRYVNTILAWFATM